jgi:site-specific DNA recombinase
VNRCERNERTSRLIYTEAKGQSGRRYRYFLCRGRQEGVCDLPYLPADVVEQAIVDHYADLQLPADFVSEVRDRLETTLSDEQGDTKILHASLTKRLTELESKESRLIDLAADGTLPEATIKAKLRELQEDRKRIEADLSGTGAELAVGVEVFLSALDLVADPVKFYGEGNDNIRRTLNQTFFNRFYLDDEGVRGDSLKPPFVEFRRAAELRSAKRAHAVKLTTADATKRGLRKVEASDRAHSVDYSLYSSDVAPTLASVLSDAGSSKANLVELPGIEPGSYGIPSRLLRAQSAMSLLGSPGHANSPG